MPIVDSELAPLRDPRLAALATSAWPVWLWNADGSRVLWANAVGAAIFGAASVRRFRPAPLQSKRHGSRPSHSPRRDTSIAVSRAARAAARVRRGLWPRPHLHLLADRSRRRQSRNSHRRGRSGRPRAEPWRACAAALPRGRDAIAAFGTDGALVYANAAAQAKLGGATTLSALGIAELVAPETGSIQATARIGDSVRRPHRRAPRQG